MDSWELKERQKLPLEIKERMSKDRIRQWFDHWRGYVYVSFSGGKDSTVLLHLVRSLYPQIPAVFVDTGLEYPEIKQFVKTIPKVVWLKPKMPFKKVIEKYGYPVVSKRQARYISDLQRSSKENVSTTNLRLTGMNRNGNYCPSMKIAKKWIPLVNAEFKVSEKCCEYMKKEPFKRYQKQTGRMPITGVMAYESSMRKKEYLKTGCNSFESKTNPISMPIAFWLEADIWNYLKKYKLPYSSIYDMGETRTGCMFCMFGVHLEKEKNRFQRMKETHPKHYNLCINKLGCGKVLDFIGVDYGKSKGDDSYLAVL